MNVEIITKIPLIKIQKETTRDRLLRLYGSKLCLIYSESNKGYQQGEEWVSDPNVADLKTFKECYESTKDDRIRNIVYCIIKI